MQAIIEGNLYEIEPAVKVILDRVMTENAELKRENKRLEEGYQKSIGVIAATDCAECKKDAEPVKHGHWIEKNDRITCSNCGREVMYNSDYLPQTTHFCYNCGAKMENGKDFDFNNSLLRSWE